MQQNIAAHLPVVNPVGREGVHDVVPGGGQAGVQDGGQRHEQRAPAGVG